MSKFTEMSGDLRFDETTFKFYAFEALRSIYQEIIYERTH